MCNLYTIVSSNFKISMKITFTVVTNFDCTLAIQQNIFFSISRYF